MTPTPPDVKSIFGRALEIESPARRAAYLDEACGPDAGLRAEVEGLLSALGRAGDFLRRPAAAAAGGLTAGYEPVPEGPGTRVGPYKLLQQIGEGGMGVVYMAEQEQPIRRRVALKIIKPGMDSKQVIARFEAERQALAMMDHTNIAKVLDAGTTESGRPYFVMELVHGVPITQFCDDNKLTPRERLGLFVGVCQAVQHAHTKGVIHRDLKPSNVLVTMYDDRPVPKVIDFGVAKAVEQRLTEKTMFTQFGALVGTFEYMSPEQAEMNALGVDTRSDVYSLGVLLYELLTGTTPLERKRLREAALDELVRLIREEEPPKPSTRLSRSGDLPRIAAARRTEPARLARAVRGEVDWIVMRCLEKDRTRRYETAAALARDVERHLADEPVEACPPSAGYRLRKFARRHKAPLAAGAAFAALLLAGAVVSTREAVRATRAEGEAVAQRDLAAHAEREAARERDAARAAGDRLLRTLYASDMNLAQAAWEANNVDRLLGLLDRHRPPPGGPDLRGFEWYYWRRQCRADLSTVEVPALTGARFGNGVLAGAAFDRAGGRLAAGVRSAKAGLMELRVWGLAGGEEQLVIPCANAAGVSAVGFSPAGDRLAFEVIGADGWENSAVRVWDLRGRREVLSVKRGDTAAFSPDGRRLAVAAAPAGRDQYARKRTVSVRDIDTGKEVFTRTVPGLVRHLAFSPDGTRLATSEMVFDTGPRGRRSGVRVCDAASGKDGWVFSLPAGTYPESAEFSPDGRRVVAAVNSFGRRRCAVQTWDAATGKVLTTVPTPHTSVEGLRFSPGGRLIAVWGVEHHTVTLLDPAGGQVARTLRGHRRSILGAAFRPDGRRLLTASADGTVKAWDVPVSADPPRDEPAALAMAVSRDGTRVALSARLSAKAITVRDPDGKERRSLAVPAGHSHGAVFSPDGGRLAVVWHLEEGPGEPYRVLLWKVATGEKLLDVSVSEGLPGSPSDFGLAFSPDGRRLAAGFHRTDPANPSVAVSSGVKVWDTAGGKEVLSLRRRSSSWTTAVAFSPDGKWLAEALSGEDGGVRVWEAATGREVRTIRAPGGTFPCLSFGPDGRTLAAGQGDYGGVGAVRGWDVETGGERFTLVGHSGPVKHLAFSPDGRRIATLGGPLLGDAEVKVWDAGSGQELLSLKARTATDVFFSADGRRLVASLTSPAGPGRSWFQVWDATPLPEGRRRGAGK